MSRTATRIPAEKIYFIAYNTAVGANGRAVITAATARSKSGRTLTFEGADCLAQIFETLNNNGATVVWVWNMEKFGAFCDYFALSRGLPDFRTAAKQKGKNAAAEACYNILYAAQHGVLMFRLTLARTKKTHAYGHGKIGGLHTVEYRGLKTFFRNGDFWDIVADLKVPGEDMATAGINLYKAFSIDFFELTAEDIENVYTLRNVYTIGGAARRKYLNLKYGSPRLKKYQKDNFQTEDGDKYFRERRLLLSGMCFFPEVNRGKLIHAHLYKYDVNGLYSYISNVVGSLAYPMESNYKEFRRDKSGQYVYIIVLKSALLCRRVEMPNCFANPFTGETGNIIEITNEWAVFGELWDALTLYYMIEDFEVRAVYRCRKFNDSTIVKYNDFFTQVKKDAKNSGNHTQYLLAKLFLNNLPGKMVQNTYYRESKPYYNIDDDCVHFKDGDLINNWESGHFHFIRGAYIYTMARVKVMQDIYTLLKMCKNPSQHHFYTDTDSIVTDIEMPASMVDAHTLGKYKIEEKYAAFGVLAHKMYYGYTIDGRHCLTVAGLKKKLVYREIVENYGDNLTPKQFFAALTAPTGFTMPVMLRLPGGAAWTTAQIKLKDIESI